MREIITLQIGRTGNSIGEKFWQYACDEHAIALSGAYYGQSDLQLERIKVYFTEARNGRFIPRSIFTDLSEDSLNQIRRSNARNLFNPEWIIHGKTGASNNFAKGYFTEGAEILPEVIDKVRRMVEECDLVHGFQLVHSVSGGAGGGFGALLMDHIRQEYPDRMIKSYSVFPSLSMSQVVVEPYNAVLSMTRNEKNPMQRKITTRFHLDLMDSTDETFCFDNTALFDIITKTVRLPAGNFADINQLLARVMIGITACFRFPGQLNMDLRKLAVNMIPFPSLHFLITSFSPLQARGKHSYRNLTENVLVEQMFDRNNQMLAFDSRQTKYLTATGIFRGKSLSMKILHEVLAKEKLKENFLPWIPNNCKVACCDIPSKELPRSVTGIANNTGIVKEFDCFLQPFSKLFQRRAFLHWFIGEGMEETELTEAAGRVKDLINDYQQYKNSTDEHDRHQ